VLILAGAGTAPDGDCSCTPVSRGRRGGNAKHNFCADLYTSYPHFDREMEGRYFDGEITPLHQMTEVKTGLAYRSINALDLQGDKVAHFFRAVIILKQEAIIVRDLGIAGICGYDYGYHAEDDEIVKDMQQYLQGIGPKAHVAELCH
jgi:hypothetical protein